MLTATIIKGPVSTSLAFAGALLITLPSAHAGLHKSTCGRKFQCECRVSTTGTVGVRDNSYVHWTTDVESRRKSDEQCLREVGTPTYEYLSQGCAKVADILETCAYKSGSLSEPVPVSYEFVN